MGDETVLAHILERAPQVPVRWWSPRNCSIVEHQTGLTTLPQLQTAEVGTVARYHRETAAVFGGRYTSFVTCNVEIAAVFADLEGSPRSIASVFLAFATLRTAVPEHSHNLQDLVDCSQQGSSMLSSEFALSATAVA